MEKCASAGHKSIAFPAMGMGNRGYPPDVGLKSLIDAVVNHSESYLRQKVSCVKLYLLTGKSASKDLEVDILTSVRAASFRVEEICALLQVRTPASDISFGC